MKQKKDFGEMYYSFGDIGESIFFGFSPISPKRVDAQQNKGHHWKALIESYKIKWNKIIFSRVRVNSRRATVKLPNTFEYVRSTF